MASEAGPQHTMEDETMKISRNEAIKITRELDLTKYLAFDSQQTASNATEYLYQLNGLLRTLQLLNITYNFNGDKYKILCQDGSWACATDKED